MGLVRMGPPMDLLTKLQSEFGLRYFLETGTYHGDTACWAAKHFEDVITIEASPTMYEATSTKYGHIDNIKFSFGDSRHELRKMTSGLQSPGVFWLDAHWSGGATYGESDQCPVLEEIAIINQSAFDHFILIDDARLFMSPPQHPHRIDQWPSLVAIIDILNSPCPKYVVIIEDVIIAVPQSATPIVAEYCQSVNARIWEAYNRSVRTRRGPAVVTTCKGILTGLKRRLRMRTRYLMSHSRAGNVVINNVHREGR